MTNLYEQYQTYLKNVLESITPLQDIYKDDSTYIFKPGSPEDLEKNGIKFEDSKFSWGVLQNCLVIIIDGQSFFLDLKTKHMASEDSDRFSPIISHDFGKQYPDIVEHLKPFLDTYKSKNLFNVLAPGMKIRGSLYLNDSNIYKLPDNLTVNGDLNLNNCKNLKSLPRGLVVKNNLYLKGTRITEFPDDIKVRGFIYTVDYVGDESYLDHVPEYLKSKIRRFDD